MSRTTLRVAIPLLAVAVAAGAAMVDTDVVVQGDYVALTLSPDDAGTVGEFGLRATVGNYAGGDGLLQEGFGVANPYVPNRRLNEKLEVDETVTDRPVIHYSYDCDGPNIRGLHVTRVMEPLPHEASLRVRWRIENRGDERQWTTPWVRNDVAPGGRFGPEDRIDVPTLEGVRQVTRTQYTPASRNWIAATDPIERVTLYAVFHADHTHSFLTLWDEQQNVCGFQAAFVPRLLGPGDVWETTYRINAVRGLKHVDFAGEELAVQLDYESGRIQLLVAAVKPLRNIQIHPSVVAPNGRRWKLAPQRFDIDPNRVVRCTFDWQAPADGAYDFLAQLRSGRTEPLELGRETAPPHGGIDTQFVVGRQSGHDPNFFEAWTDAPYALERGSRRVKRPVTLRDGTAVWVESALDKVFRNDVVEPDGDRDAEARVRLARNEHESFQVVIRPPRDTDLFNVFVQVGGLLHDETGATLAASPVRLSNVGYHSVRVPSFFEGPTGEWPDALPPHEPFTAEGGGCTPVWVTVYAPADAAPGTYRGALVITAIGLTPVRVPIEVTVYDFALPVTPTLKTDFGFWPARAIELCRDKGCTLSDQDVAERYLANALAHRVTLRGPGQFPAPAAGYAAELSKFGPRLKDLVARGATTFAVPPALKDHPEQLAQANAFVANNHLRKRAYCQIAAEPPPATWPGLVETMQAWKETAPDIPLMISTFGLQPFLAHGVDIWNVHTPILDTLNNTPILERVGQGEKEVWWFVNNYPPRPYANFFIDFAAIEHRILFWQTWALGIHGVHYWSINYTRPGQDPYATQLDATPVNGDGFLVYPGPYGPVNSIRWETIRDGLEDHDYLALFMDRKRKLEARGGHGALLERAAKASDLSALVPDLVSYTREPEVLLGKRDEIARLIVEIGEAL